MKKVIISIVLLLFAFPCFAETLEGGVDFDWITKTQLQRDENISKIQNIVLTEPTPLKHPKQEFRKYNASFLKDTEHNKNYEEITNGKKEDADKIYCGFFLKNHLLIAYGIQFKNNMKNIYYYDAMGTLRWIDSFSDNYPTFPYIASQYDANGRLVASYYYVSDSDQYVYDANKSFKGRWYKDKLYNKKAKVIMTRSNY